MSSHSAMKFDREESIVSLNDDWVQVEAVYTTVLPKQGNIGGLVGRVVGVGKDAMIFSVGDVVIAFAPPKPIVTLRADSCRKILDEGVINKSMAFWVFALTLIPAIHLSEIEIGEQVLVLSNNLVGQLVGELAILAGAVSCVVVDPTYANAFEHTVTPEMPHGLQYVADLSDLDRILPDLTIDLLIDASGDSIRLQSNLERVRNLGRFLTIGQYTPSQFDFNIYPNLHKRSLKYLNYQLPATLGEAGPQQYRQHSSWLDSSLDFVQHLFETGRLRPAIWPRVHLKAPTENVLMHTLQNTEQGTLLIEW